VSLFLKIFYQKLHTLESKNKSLVEENQRLEDEIEKYIEEAGSAELQIVNHFKLIIHIKNNF